MRRLVIALATVMASGVSTGTAVAQRRGGWAEPECEIKKGHYLINSALLYLKNASAWRYDDQRRKDLTDANRVLNEALSKGQADNGSVWYLFGRYHELTVEAAPGRRPTPEMLIAFDSTFRRAETLLPECKEDILKHRQNMWAPIFNRGVDSLKAGGNQGSKDAFRLANLVFPAEPGAVFYTAGIFMSENNNDSALAYYRRTIAITSEPANLSKAPHQEKRETSTFNGARIFHRMQQWDSAGAWYKNMRELKPNDPQALTGLAAVYKASGNEAGALALYDTVLSRADSMAPLDLFEAGVAMFQAKRFASAAQAFESGLKRNPYHRDAVYNLANSYLSMATERPAGETPAQRTQREKATGEKMAGVAKRLVEIDGQNRAALKLLAAAYRLQEKNDSTLTLLQKVEDLSFEVTVVLFQPLPAGAQVGATIANLKPQPTAMPGIVFEFVNGEGIVVASDTVLAEQLAVDAVKEYRASPTGAGIVAWRYKAGSGDKSQ